MFKRIALVLVLLCSTLVVRSAAAQRSDGERIELEASDGLALIGLYYAPTVDTTDPVPGVLLMHHGGSQKEAWIDLIPALVEAGYGVLAVDLRGHGETGGSIDWVLGEDDAARWLDWLRSQPGIDPERVSIVGASIGADVGLRVMAKDERIVTLVGLSVGLDVMGVKTEEAVVEIGERPLYLAAGQGAVEEADAVRTLLGVAQGDVQVRLYDNDACCTYFFLFDRQLIGSIISWLDAHN